MEPRDMLVVLASIAFLLVIMWRNRPQLGGEREAPITKKLARALETTTDPEEKSRLLFEAGQQALSALRFARAESYFRRALRLQPLSVELLAKITQALARRAAGLELLLWRQLAEAKFDTEEERRMSRAVLTELIALYERTPKQRQRAEALRHWLTSMQQG